ncbi:SDR family NAD(P)-dependent oxidoreductase [Cognatishimia sp. SS12]|uniref:SDR family NAD(P)-dependent oxidoreductase n=1 Tax=Cognatishimia sp. SS12 TaxID=2979465 RepID=UPI00232C68F0|nr:SDR family oxidoreductase [Cognatishimia sp. SS12]MDC0739195.1 SDR family NAD(P)-dependent oxidoreductase [Cognatishimia sp. SS12]
MQKQTLSGQVALVTGGGRGIGAAISTHLAACGAKVALLGRTENSVRETAEAIGANALPIVADVTDAAALASAVATTEETFGPIDLLVNNAGVTGTPGNIADVDAQAWWRTLEINVMGVLLASKAVLPGMLARGRGRIIHMGSNAGNLAGTGVTDYSVSKTALLRFNESLASEIGTQGLLSIAVSPGVVETDMLDHFDQVFKETRSDWTGFDKDMIFPVETVTRLIERIAMGEADAFGGRFIHVKDNLDAALKNQDRILEDDLLMLRIRQID